MNSPTVGTQIAERFMPGGDAASREHLRAAIDAALSVQADAAVLDAARDFEWFGRIEIQPGQRGLAQTHDKMRTALEAQAAQSAVAWQPIDSAPRDGTVIELRWGQDGQMPGWWLEAAAEDSYQWAFFDTGCDERTFVNEAVSGEYGPSHWRPYRPQAVTAGALLTGDGTGNALPAFDATVERAAGGLDDPAAPGRTLYIDLDGVMADFDGAFPAVFGLDHRSLADEAMWSHINSHESFFRDLPPMPGAIDFFRSVEHLHPVILTACPKSNYPHVAAQKRAWVREHLSETCLVLPVLGGRHKPLFMHQPGDILVDDWGKNCVAWTEAGGVAIKHEGDFIDTRTALSTALSATGEGAPAAPSTGSILTKPMTGGAAETGNSVPPAAEGRTDG